MTVQSPRLKKHHIALLLATVALLSYVANVAREQRIVRDPGILTAVAATSANNYKMFLKLDTIQGEGGDAQHKGEINVDSYAWSVTRAGGNAKFDTIAVTMPASRASPKLFLHTAGGLKIARAVLAVKQSGSSDDFLKWILTDVTPVSFKTVGNTHGDGVVDQVVFTAGKVETEYKAGDGTGLVKAGWDQRTGKSISY